MTDSEMEGLNQVKELRLSLEGTGEPCEGLNSSDKVRFILWKGDSAAASNLCWKGVRLEATTRLGGKWKKPRSNWLTQKMEIHGLS